MTETFRNPHVQTLYTLALGDEAVLQYPLPDYIYGFHAQQSCEKLLKALLSSLNRRYPLTHSLKDLDELLAGYGEVLPMLSFTLQQMEPFAVKLRYDLSVRLSVEIRADIRDSVVRIREHVVRRILELER